MKTGAAYLVGKHDFASFCNIKTNAADTVRTVADIRITADGPDITIRVTGNGFLYNMVRIIAGTLIEVGQGKREPESMPEILAALDRGAAGPTAPAHGLTLVKYEFLS